MIGRYIDQWRRRIYTRVNKSRTQLVGFVASPSTKSDFQLKHLPSLFQIETNPRPSLHNLLARARAQRNAKGRVGHTRDSSALSLSLFLTSPYHRVQIPRRQPLRSGETHGWDERRGQSQGIMHTNFYFPFCWQISSGKLPASSLHQRIVPCLREETLQTRDSTHCRRRIKLL